MASNSRVIEIVMRMRDEMTQQLDNASRQFEVVGGRMKRVGGIMTAAVSVPLAAAGAAAVKTAIDFERSFAMVEKSVEGTPEQLNALNNELSRIATDTPLGAMENARQELDRIAAAAGRLGVEVENVPAFTEAVGALAVAADGLDAEQAAEQIARFANVTGMSLNDVDKLADTIADLGNNFATTEKDILNFGQRMATLSSFGFAEDQILALGTAMSAAGLSAELGSTNFVKGMSEITNAIATGGPELTAFADVLNMTEQQAAELFRTNPAEAILQFSQALGEMPVEQQLAALNDMGFTSVEMQRTFMALAGSSDTLSNALTRGAVAIQGNGAAMSEAQKIAQTTAGQLNLLRSNLAELGNALGAVILPAINGIVQALIPLLQALANAPQAVQTTVVVIGALVAALGPLLMLAGQIVTVWPALVSVFGAAASAIGGMGGASLAAAGPIGALVAAVGLLGWTIKRFGADAWQSFTTLLKIVGALEYKLFQALKGFGGMALNAVKGFLAAAKELGQNIMRGLIEGINDNVKKLVDAAKDMARRAARAVRDAFKIRSPSKVMAEIGGQVVDGFNEGIANGGGIGVNVPTMQTVSSAVGGGGGNVYINTINVPPGTTREQINIISREIARRARRRGAIGGV